MFPTYSLNIRRLLTQSMRCRPNLHVKTEHRRIIAEYSLAVRENCSWQCIFFRKGGQKGQILITLLSNEGSGEPAQIHRLARALAANILEVLMSMKTQTNL